MDEGFGDFVVRLTVLGGGYPYGPGVLLNREFVLAARKDESMLVDVPLFVLLPSGSALETELVAQLDNGLFVARVSPPVPPDITMPDFSDGSEGARCTVVLDTEKGLVARSGDDRERGIGGSR